LAIDRLISPVIGFSEILIILEFKNE